MSDNKTLADIAVEMRTYFQAQKRTGNSEHRPWHKVLSDWADRIEAAEKRRREERHNYELAECARCARAKTAAMRHALERILDIECYGAPMIEAKAIAQKALEGQQCTPPLAQERPQIEQPGNASALREAMNGFIHDFAVFREEVEHGKLHMMQCMDFVKECIPLMEAALAAPPDQPTDAAAMRKAVGNALWCLNWMAENTGDKPTKDHLAKPIELLTAALSAPARNCDRFTDEVDAQLAFLNEVWLISVTRETMLERDKFDNWTCEMKSEFARWLLAPAKGGAE